MEREGSNLGNCHRPTPDKRRGTRCDITRLDAGIGEWNRAPPPPKIHQYSRPVQPSRSTWSVSCNYRGCSFAVDSDSDPLLFAGAGYGGRERGINSLLNTTYIVIDSIIDRLTASICWQTEVERRYGNNYCSQRVSKYTRPKWLFPPTWEGIFLLINDHTYRMRVQNVNWVGLVISKICTRTYI